MGTNIWLQREALKQKVALLQASLFWFCLNISKAKMSSDNSNYYNYNYYWISQKLLQVIVFFSNPEFRQQQLL
jgi:hypothetical protein